MMWKSCLDSTRRKVTWSPPSLKPFLFFTLPWPLVGQYWVSHQPLPSPCYLRTHIALHPFCIPCFFPGPFTLLNKHHTEILPIDNTMANTILMVSLSIFKSCSSISCDRSTLAMCPRSRRKTCSRSPTCSRTASSAMASASSSTTICQR